MVLSDINENRWILGLDRMKKALEILGHPEASYPHVIVAGTNGKGSTCVYLEKILLASGRSVGTNLSPHLERFTERFRINGEEVDEQELLSARNRLEPAVGGLGLTYFEWCVILAAELFCKKGVDVGIFEVGLGGRFDATNALDPALSVITDISLDHTDILGSTVEQIASEKAQVARTGRPLIISATHAARKVILEHAQRIGAHSVVVDTPLTGFSLMEGSRQGINAALACEAAAWLGVRLDTRRLEAALAQARLPGRMEWLGDRIIVDVAHNEASVLVLVEHLASRGFDGVGVVGILADKDYRSMVHALRRVCRRLFLAPVKSPRSWGFEDMRCFADMDGVTVCDSVGMALDRALACSLPLVVTGSFYTVAEALERLRSDNSHALRHA